MAIGISFAINSDGKIEMSCLEERKTIREFKGNSLLTFPDNFCVIDIETTGLDPSFDEIIEIAAIKVENGKIIEEKSSLIKPSEEICEYITELTGITNEMVSNAAPIEIVLQEFLAFWDGYTLVGHNVNFDINFLYDNSINSFEKPLSNDYVDTLRLAKRLLPDLKSYKLKSLTKHFKLDESVHRALSDAKKTLTIFDQLKAICVKDYESVIAFEKTTYSKGLKASDVTSTNSNSNENHPFYDRSFVFTGALEKMVRRDAMQLVVDLGGICLDNITQKTDFLVLGNQDYSKIKDGKSSKQKKAEKLKLGGHDIEIISENVFYDMLDY